MARRVQLLYPGALMTLLCLGIAPALATSEAKLQGSDGHRWQARLGVATASAAALPSLGRPLSSNGSIQSASVLGDYYFGRALAAASGREFVSGFRATGGVLIGPRYTLATSLTLPSVGSSIALGRQQLLDAELGSGAGLPYLGIGYSVAAGKYSGLSFQADVGVLMQNPGSLPRLGRAFTGGLRMDDVLRELRWAPLVTVGVSYAF